MAGERIVWEETGATLAHDGGAGGRAVVICPGGGYEYVSTREGAPVAARFAGAGWRPFVLAYSVGERLGVRPLREAAWAVRTARRLCGADGSPPFVAVCGFSAGGHLAASLGAHWDDAAVFSGFSAAERRDHRPDALVLSYPVVTAGEFRHADSFRRLARDEDDRAYFSLENWVTETMPPAFLWHTAEDADVPVENSLLLAEALRARRVPFELHVFPFGPHGLSLATPEVEDAAKGRFTDPCVARWMEWCLAWLDGMAGWAGRTH